MNSHVFSIHSLQPSRMAWGWDCRSVARSWNAMAGEYGRWRTSRRALPFTSPSLLRTNDRSGCPGCNSIAEMAAANSNSHLLGNSAWNASAFVVSVGLNLLILPFVLSRLGASLFGVAGLVTACIAPAQAFSNALALSTTRELAHRLAPGERDDARRFFASALLLTGAGGLPI